MFISFNPTLTTAISRNISGLSIFLSSKIDTLSTSVTGVFNISNNPGSDFKVKSLNNSVYVMGKPFNRYLAYSRYFEVTSSSTTYSTIKASNFDTNSYSGLFPFSSSTAIEVTGIPRLAISHLDATS